MSELIPALRTPVAAPGTGAVAIGMPVSRVDGRDKVTGRARYAAEHLDAPEASDGPVLHGVVVSSTIARGRVLAIDDAATLAVPGVVAVISHLNRPPMSRFDLMHKDMTSPGGSPFRPFYDDRVRHSGQPLALVVADSFEAARHGAGLLRIRYHSDAHQTDMTALIDKAKQPSHMKAGYTPPPKPKGHPDEVWEKAAVRVDGEYHEHVEHHNPLEMFASTVLRAADGHLTIYDKTQSSQNSRWYVYHVFGVPKEKVTVRNPYVGGAFGSGLRPQYQLALAVMAALKLEHSVRVVLSRQ